MTAEPKRPFWAKCPACGHCWPIAYYPAEIGEFVRIAEKAYCPHGCKDAPRIAKQRDGKLKEKAK
jgi:hypothetical protein